MTTTTRATRPETSRIPDVVDLLTSLVACDSTNPTGEEESTAALLGEALAAAGFETTIDTLAPGKVNLTARLRLGAGGRSIMLNSHLDVVPAGIGWTSAPFEPEVRDGRLFGRGSADAKGPLAAMACAAIELAQSGTITTGEIVYSAVSQEEGDSAGARRLVPELVGAGRLPDAVIVGEPTGMRLLTAHKGSIRPVIEVVGRSAHAATPQFGVNAVVAAGQLLGLLEDYATELGGRRHPLLGAATCTPVLVGGGEAPNAVPERCRITLDRRLLPDESPDAVLTAINEVLARFAEQTPGATASVAELAPSTGGPSETPGDHPFVVGARRALAANDADDSLGGLTVNCDMTHFRAAGVPTLVCGPGQLEVMHAVDEHVVVDELAASVGLYRAILAESLTSTEPYPS